MLIYCEVEIKMNIGRGNNHRAPERERVKNARKTEDRG